MTPRPFVYHGYVCYNYGTTLPQYLERIPFHGKEQVHRGLRDLGNRMKVGGHNDRLSPHPDAIDLDSNNSISYELEQVCGTKSIITKTRR